MAILGWLQGFLRRKEIGVPKKGVLLPLVLILGLSPLLALGSFKPVEIKAAYLYNLANFVHWPETTMQDGDFVIEVLGNPELARNLALLTKGEKLEGRSIIVRSINSVEEIHDCQILFVDSSREQEVSARLLEKLAQKHTLIVGNSRGFLQKGAMVGLVLTGKRIIIAINTRLAERVGISFSSKLLKVARIF